MAELPKIDSDGLRVAKREAAKQVSSVVRVSRSAPQEGTMPLAILDTDFNKADYVLSQAGLYSDALRQSIAEAIAMERAAVRRALEQQAPNPTDGPAG